GGQPARPPLAVLAPQFQGAALGGLGVGLRGSTQADELGAGAVGGVAVLLQPVGVDEQGEVVGPVAQRVEEGGAAGGHKASLVKGPRDYASAGQRTPAWSFLVSRSAYHPPRGLIAFAFLGHWPNGDEGEWDAPGQAQDREVLAPGDLLVE